MPFGQIWVSRRNLVQDLTHRYLVYIDGNVVGELPAYRTAKYEVAAGRHRVWARRPDMPPAQLGDILVHVHPNEIRRVRTTSRLKRMSFFRLLWVLATSMIDREGHLSVEFTPSILLRANPGADDGEGPS
jgi:hypothetical protein